VEFPDGKHNQVNTREEMKRYDPKLYDLIHLYFSEFEESPTKHKAENRFAVK
jgi:alpha-glucosidase